MGGAALLILGHGEFLGHEVTRASAGAFVVTFRRSGSDLRDKTPHFHDSPNVLLALDEGYWSEADGFDEVNPSQLIYTPGGTAHRDSMVRLGGRYLCIAIEDSIVRDTEWELPNPVVLQRPNALRIAHTIALHSVGGTASELFLEDACLSLIAELGSRVARESRARWLNHAVEFCQSRFGEPFGIADVGNSIGVHPVHVSRVFRACYGVSLSKYIISTRVQRAAAALRSGNLSLACVAAQTGFSDQSHLCKTFKKIMGIAPSGYRRLFAQSGRS